MSCDYTDTTLTLAGTVLHFSLEPNTHTHTHTHVGEVKTAEHTLSLCSCCRSVWSKVEAKLGVTEPQMQCVGGQGVKGHVSETSSD